MSSRALTRFWVLRWYVLQCCVSHFQSQWHLSATAHSDNHTVSLWHSPLLTRSSCGTMKTAKSWSHCAITYCHLQSTWHQWQTHQNLHKNMIQLTQAITPQRGHIFLWFNIKSSSVFSSLDAPAIHFSIRWLWVKLDPGSPICHWRHLARELTTI